MNSCISRCGDMQSSNTFVEQFGVNGYLNWYAEYKTLVDNYMPMDS